MKTIEKIRAIVAWANNMDEHFNDRVRDVQDWEVLYDLAEEHGMEFIDDEYIDNHVEDNTTFFAVEANESVGYRLYNCVG